MFWHYPDFFRNQKIAETKFGSGAFGKKKLRLNRSSKTKKTFVVLLFEFTENPVNSKQSR